MTLTRGHDIEMNVIHDLFDFQKDYQAALGQNPHAVESLRYYVLCAVDELMELLHEIPGWKRHRPVPGVWADREKVAEECVDALVFLTNVMIGVGIGPGEFEDAVRQVIEKNRKRFAEGANKAST